MSKPHLPRGADDDPDGSGAAPDAGSPIRLFVVDDHQLLREQYRLLAELEPRLVVAGDAATAEQALDALASCAADVVLADYSLPGMDGIQLALALRERTPTLPVVLVSGYNHDRLVDQAFAAGVRAFVDKAEVGDVLVEAVRQVLDGAVYLSPSVADRRAGGEAAG